ncbi:MAG: helix-turn-helix domain-containing protein [Planctomycetota bacterium]
MSKRGYITIPQLAKMLGVSRIAVYKKVKKGQIKAERIGRSFAIPQKYVSRILGEALPKEDKSAIDRAVKKTVTEYGEALRLLGNE